MDGLPALTFTFGRLWHDVSAAPRGWHRSQPQANTGSGQGAAAGSAREAPVSTKGAAVLVLRLPRRGVGGAQRGAGRGGKASQKAGCFLEAPQGLLRSPCLLRGLSPSPCPPLRAADWSTHDVGGPGPDVTLAPARSASARCALGSVQTGSGRSAVRPAPVGPGPGHGPVWLVRLGARSVGFGSVRGYHETFFFLRQFLPAPGLREGHLDSSGVQSVLRESRAPRPTSGAHACGRRRDFQGPRTEINRDIGRLGRFAAILRHARWHPQ